MKKRGKLLLFLVALLGIGGLLIYGTVDHATLRARLHDVRVDVRSLRARFNAAFNPAPNPPPALASSARQDVVTVDAGTAVHTLSPTFFGVNYVAFWDTHQGSLGSSAALAQTPIKLVRFGGGDPGDYYDWAEPFYTGGGGGSWSGTSPLDLWKYTQRFGGMPLFQTAYQSYNLPNPPVTPQEICQVHPAQQGNCEQDQVGPRQPYSVNDPLNQAAWVRYNRSHGIKAVMEVGNEEDIHDMDMNDVRFQPYIYEFKQQARAMHGADPGVQVIGPAATNEWQWWARNGLDQFLKQAGNRNPALQPGEVTDGVSLHFYKGSNWDDTKGVAQYWLTHPWPYIQSTIRADDTRQLPVYISEWNIGGGGAYNVTLGHGLVQADMIGAFAQSGVAGEEYFALHGTGNFGMLYDDDTATPTYYAMALWKHMGTHVLSLDQRTPAGQQLDAAGVVSAYSTRRDDGSVQVMLINKQATTQAVQVRFSHYNPSGATLRAYTLSGSTGSVTDTVSIYDGTTNPSPQRPLPGAVSTRHLDSQGVSYTVPAHSAVVLDLAGGTPAPLSAATPAPSGPTPSSRPIDTATLGSVHLGNGLVGYWPLDENGGATARDYSPNHNDGTLAPGASWTDGVSGGALNLDGHSGYLATGVNGLPAANAPQSISFWLRLPSISGDVQSLLSLTNDAANSGRNLGLRDGSLGAWNSGAIWVAAVRPPSPNTWHQYTYTFDGTTHMFYVDGVLQSRSTVPTQDQPPTALNFGRWTGGKEYTHAQLDEVRLYNRALDASEALALARLQGAAAPPPVPAAGRIVVPQAGLIGSWPFKEGQGATVSDVASYRNNGTLNGGAHWISDPSGSALAFDGTGYVAMPTAHLPAPGAPQSISLWVKAPMIPGWTETILSLSNEGAHVGRYFGFRNGTAGVWEYGGANMLGTALPAANTWYHYVYTFDGSVGRLYVDGTLRVSLAHPSSQVAPTALNLGRWTGGAEYFAGQLGDVRIYNRALSAPEVASFGGR